MDTSLWLMTLFLIKHFVVDFPMQCSWMYKNKGDFLHPGGYAHAGLHGVATFIILVLATSASPKLIAWIATFEFVMHYIIDYFKVVINAKNGWRCNNSDKYWTMVGLDQLLHGLTYVVLIMLVS